MCSSYPNGYVRKRSEIFLIMAKWGCSCPTKPFFFFFFYFFLVKHSKKGKMDKYNLTNNKITGDKPSQQLFLKLVATQLPLLT